MSKFNTTSRPEMTVNNCGHAAYAMDDKSKLVTMVLTSFFNEEKFYGDNSEELTALAEKVIRKDPGFVSKLAVYARRVFNMRSVSHVLVGYLAKVPEGKPYVRETVKGVTLRGDDATEILAFYLSKFGKPIPNSLRKALRDVFGTFDAYTLAKYKGTGKDVTMKDILNLTHPVPADDKQSETWKALLDGTLQPAYTWETELSVKGNTKETWEALIDSGRVGYMALLRNLRNIINSGADNMYDVFLKIANGEEVLKSKQLPFRFLSAYKSLGNSWSEMRAKDALEVACECSIKNMPKIPGKTVIAIDVSGSMCTHVSAKSDIRCSDIAMMLGAIANQICEESMVLTFDTTIEQMHMSKRSGILKDVAEYLPRGGGTNIHLPFQYLMDMRIDCDRVIILSDNECNCGLEHQWWYDERKTVQESADEYRKQSGNDIWVHAIDLMGYGTQQFKGAKTNIIAGWSEKVFEFINLAEMGEGALVQRIQEYSYS